MSTANLPIIPPTLPAGWCPTDWQSLINEGVGKSIVQFTSSSFTVIISSASAPAAADRDKLWFNTNDDRIYRYHDGAWLHEHPEAPNGLSRRIYVGSLTQLQSYDGGDTDAAGDASGPMWERDTDFNDRIPMGVGAALALLVGTNYGDSDASLTLTDGQITHKHLIANTDVLHANGTLLTSAQQLVRNLGTVGDDEYTLVGSSTDATVGLTSVPTGTVATTKDPVNILNPVRGVYIARRTSRIYYKAS